MSFNKKLQGLLGSPMFNMGVGLLAAGQTRRGPKIGMGQALMEATQYASSRQSQINKLEAERRALEQDEKREEAISRLGKVLSTPQMTQQQANQMSAGLLGIQGTGQGGTPLNPLAIGQISDGGNVLMQANQAEIAKRRAEIPGLMAQISPQAYVQGAMAQQAGSTAPSNIRETTMATGLYPGDPNFYEAHMKMHYAIDPAQQQQLKLLEYQTEAARLNADEARRTQALSQSQVRSDTRTALNSFAKISEANNVLRDTFMEAGKVFPAERAGLANGVNELLEMFGKGDPKATALQQAYNTFEKESSILQGALAVRLGANTNVQFRNVGNSIPNMSIDPNTNDALVRQGIQDLLIGAEELGIDIPNIDYYRNFLLDTPENATELR